MPALIRHPASHGAEAFRIEASAKRDGHRLALEYAASGDMHSVHRPPIKDRARTDELWRHTCFEAFVRPVGEAGYHEFNLAPSGDWAAYHFDEYRAGMTLAEAEDPGIEIFVTPRRLSLRAAVAVPFAGAWQVGLTAVIETMDGDISYWALAHAPDKPDFHDAAGYVLELAP